MLHFLFITRIIIFNLSCISCLLRYYLIFCVHYLYGVILYFLIVIFNFSDISCSLPITYIIHYSFIIHYSSSNIFCLLSLRQYLAYIVLYLCYYPILHFLFVIFKAVSCISCSLSLGSRHNNLKEGYTFLLCRTR